MCDSVYDNDIAAVLVIYIINIFDDVVVSGVYCAVICSLIL